MPRGRAAPGFGTSGSANDAGLNDLLDSRFICRAFQDRGASRPVIEQILTLAQRSASWCNGQPWQVIVTNGAGTDRFRDGICECARNNSATFDFDASTDYTGVCRERRSTTGWQLYEAVGVVLGDREPPDARRSRTPGCSVICTSRSSPPTASRVSTALSIASSNKSRLSVPTFSNVGLADCARFVATHGIDVDTIFSDRWGIEDTAAAYRKFDKQTRGKAVIEF